MLCLDFKYLWLTASSESTKIVEPVIAQLEVFTDEISEIPTGTIADKNVKVRSVNVFLFRLRAKMQILITLYGHMFKNNPAIWLH